VTAAWFQLCPLEAVPRNGHGSFEAAGRYIAVYDVQGERYAIEDVCTHDGEPLADAPVEVEDGVAVVVCPRHGARFCLRTGAALSPPAYEPVTPFQLKAEAGHLWVELPE
jgi:3-phenylpropionate/trans-cinnamate dioxygenase ferredoxin component